MRTVFITCFTGLISRNILATDAFEILRREPHLRLVIVTPQSREEVLKKEHGGPNVLIEGVKLKPFSRGERILWILATNLLPSHTRRIQRLAKLEQDKSRLDYFFSGLLGQLGRARLVRQLFRFLADEFSSISDLEYLFEKYKPDLLFAADVYTPLDVKLMRLARRLKIKTVGMVRSWDNVTSKTLLSFIPDAAVVNTERIKQELVHYGDVDPDSVFTAGVPHYDRYKSRERSSRSGFFKNFGFDPEKKLILFTPPSDNYLKYDPITPIVLRALEKISAQILVRMPLVGKTDLGDYRPPPHVVFDKPSNSPDFIEAHLSREADRHLADSVYHCDVVVTWASTLIIDAMVFNKPVVLVGFDAGPRPFGQSITQYYGYDHQQDIIKKGGVRLVKTPSELIDWVKRYLTDPGLDSRNRLATAHEFAGPLDGRAGKRLAEFLLKLL